MSVRTRHNKELVDFSEGEAPVSTGDRYWASDLKRDWDYVLSHIAEVAAGLVLELVSGTGSFPAGGVVVHRDMAVSKTGSTETVLRVPPCMGITKIPRKVMADAAWTTPYPSETVDCYCVAILREQRDINLSQTSGKMGMLPIDTVGTHQRQRQFASGQYAFYIYDDVVLGEDLANMCVLCDFEGAGSDLQFTMAPTAIDGISYQVGLAGLLNRLKRLESSGGFLPPAALGANPTQAALTAYALTQIDGAEEAADILNQTRFKNSTDNNTWVWNSPSSTWTVDPKDQLQIATATTLGGVKSRASTDGAGYAEIEASTGKILVPTGVNPRHGIYLHRTLGTSTYEIPSDIPLVFFVFAGSGGGGGGGGGGANGTSTTITGGGGGGGSGQAGATGYSRIRMDTNYWVTVFTVGGLGGAGGGGGGGAGGGGGVQGGSGGMGGAGFTGEWLVVPYIVRNYRTVSTNRVGGGAGGRGGGGGLQNSAGAGGAGGSGGSSGGTNGNNGGAGTWSSGIGGNGGTGASFTYVNSSATWGENIPYTFIACRGSGSAGYAGMYSGGNNGSGGAGGNNNYQASSVYLKYLAIGNVHMAPGYYSAGTNTSSVSSAAILRSYLPIDGIYENGITYPSNPYTYGGASGSPGSYGTSATQGETGGESCSAYFY